MSSDKPSREYSYSIGVPLLAVAYFVFFWMPIVLFFVTPSLAGLPYILFVEVPKLMASIFKFLPESMWPQSIVVAMGLPSLFWAFVTVFLYRYCRLKISRLENMQRRIFFLSVCLFMGLAIWLSSLVFKSSTFLDPTFAGKITQVDSRQNAAIHFKGAGRMDLSWKTEMDPIPDVDVTCTIVNKGEENLLYDFAKPNPDGSYTTIYSEVVLPEASNVIWSGPLEKMINNPKFARLNCPDKGEVFLYFHFSKAITIEEPLKLMVERRFNI